MSCTQIPQSLGAVEANGKPLSAIRTLMKRYPRDTEIGELLWRWHDYLCTARRPVGPDLLMFYVYHSAGYILHNADEVPLSDEFDQEWGKVSEQMEPMRARIVAAMRLWANMGVSCSVSKGRREVKADLPDSRMRAWWINFGNAKRDDHMLTMM